MDEVPRRVVGPGFDLSIGYKSLISLMAEVHENRTHLPAHHRYSGFEVHRTSTARAERLRVSRPAITYAVRWGQKIARKKGHRLIEASFRRAMIWWRAPVASIREVRGMLT